MQKITRYADIPKFTRESSYAVNYDPCSLLRWLDEEVEMRGLQLDPDFQRAHVWTRRQQIAFVQYFLRGGRTGRDIHFNHPSWHRQSQTGYDDYVLVDGKQRVQAFRAFLADEFRVFGSYASEFTDRLRAFYTLKAHVNDLQTRAEVLQWYLDFNSGGTVHSERELKKVRRLLKKENVNGGKNETSQM